MSSNDRTIILEIDSRLDCVSLVGVSLQALCLKQGMDEMTTYQVQTCAIEAINNAIIHAYQNQAGHPVRILWCLADRQLTLQVSDTGKAMAQTPPNIEPAPDAESGRGWWIMRQWMDSAEYRTDAGRNIVTLRKNLNR